jgi:hypothetical protein
MDVKYFKDELPQLGDKIAAFFESGGGCHMYYVDERAGETIYVESEDGDDCSLSELMDYKDRWAKLPDDFVFSYMESIEPITCVGMWRAENEPDQRPIVIRIEALGSDSFDAIEERARSTEIENMLRDNLAYGPDDFDKEAWLEGSKSAVFRLSYCLAGHPDIVMNWVDWRDK